MVADLLRSSGTMNLAPTSSPLTLVRLLTALVRRRRLVVVGLVLGALIGLVVGLVTPRTWKTTATFIPTSQGGLPSSLSALASQFSLTLPSGSPEESPGFYVSLIKSQPIIDSLITSSYQVKKASGRFGWGADTLVTGDLPSVYDVRANTPGIRRALATKLLLKQMDVSADDQTGIVTVHVTTRWAALSASIAQRVLLLVQQFDTRTRQSQAGAERRFAEGRLKESEVALAIAEDSAEAFLLRNRQFNSPSLLQLQLDRLQREVQMRQQVVTGLRQAYEQARLEEARATPQITVIAPGNAPDLPEPRRLPLKLVLGALLGAVLAMTWVLIALARVEASPGDPIHDLFTAIAETRAQLSIPTHRPT